MIYKTIVPAYGRDYRSAKAAKADFLAGKDFLIADAFDRYDGKPCNLEDLKAAGIGQVNIRFKGQTQIAAVKI